MPEMLELLYGIHRRKFGQNVLAVLADGPRRYADIARAMGQGGQYIHAQTLVKTLEYLQNNLGVITKRQRAYRTEYALTAAGEQLLTAIAAIKAADASPNHHAQ